MHVGRCLFSAMGLAALVSCGDDAAFEACGGNAVGAWTIVSTSLVQGSSDDCSGSGASSGDLFLNPNGRYSIMATVPWRKTPDAPCGFTSLYGGFYRVKGSQVCFGDSSVQGEAIPCGETRPTSFNAVADFCVKARRMRLRSSGGLLLEAPIELELEQRE